MELDQRQLGKLAAAIKKIDFAQKIGLVTRTPTDNEMQLFSITGDGVKGQAVETTTSVASDLQAYKDDKLMQVTECRNDGEHQYVCAGVVPL